jgi:F0F1-type ATP synthase delta subunit
VTVFFCHLSLLICCCSVVELGKAEIINELLKRGKNIFIDAVNVMREKARAENLDEIILFFRYLQGS